jgi:hypothetical protein
MIRNYPNEIFDIFLSSLRGNNKEFEKLLEKAPSLAAVSNALKGDSAAEKWLEVRADKFFHEYYLILDGNEGILEFLRQDEDKFPLYFAMASIGKSEGIYWLKHNDYQDFAELADEIFTTLKLEKRKRKFWYNIFN